MRTEGGTMNRELETDGVPAPSEFELTGDRADRIRQLLKELVTERDGWRSLAKLHTAEAERLAQEVDSLDRELRALANSNAAHMVEARNLAAEVERLRGALEKVEFVAGWCPWCEYFQYHRFDCARKLALAPHECAGDYCEACDKCVGA